MKRYFSVIVLFIAFLFVSACSKESVYNTEMVSTSYNKSYSISNQNEDILKANVMIFNNNYSSILGLKYKENNSYGSGVIYKSDNNYYYVLTNNHVVSYDYSFNKHELYVEDYYQNRYDAEVLYKDVNYDLAIVRFKKNIDLGTLKISENEISSKMDVRSMGNPSSIKNVISEGKIDCFGYVSLDSTKSNIEFEVIVHSAAIAGGSSGGALLDSNNEIIGITFAGVFDRDGIFITGYAIPSEKIIEFLNK